MNIIYINYFLFPEIYYFVYHFCYPEGFPAFFALSTCNVDRKGFIFVHHICSSLLLEFILSLHLKQSRVSWNQLRRTNTIFQIKWLNHNEEKEWVTINFSIVIREVSFSKTEDLFLEFNLEWSDDIPLVFNVKTITLLIKAHFAGRILSIILKIIFYGSIARNQLSLFWTGALFLCI